MQRIFEKAALALALVAMPCGPAWPVRSNPCA